MRKPTWITIPLAGSFLLLLVLLGLSPQTAQAQTPNEPPLQIVAIETAQFPTVQLTLSGSTWPTDRLTAPVAVLVNGAAQTVSADQTEQQPLGFMVAIDANELFVSGQERYVAMTGALLDLIENEILLRNQDWLAADLLLPSAVQSIQTWTQEPNLVFNSIVQQQPPEIKGAPLAAATLVNALQRFRDEPVAATPHKALLLISSGTSGLEAEPVVAAAQELGVQIYVVELVNGASAPSASALAQVAQESGGHYLALSEAASLQPLWERIAAAHDSRVLTFVATVADPQTLEVRLQLPSGTTVSATAEPAAFAGLPVQPAGAKQLPATPETAPVVETVATQAETQSTVVYSLPASSEQVAAAPPATETEPVAAVVPAAETGSGIADSAPGVVALPTSGLGIPRGLLQVGLVILLGLIAYFGYAEVRDRRQQRNRRAQPNQAADPLFNLEDNSKPLPASQFRLQGQADRPTRTPPPNPPTAWSAPPPNRVTPPTPPPARPTALFQEDDEEGDELTVRPARQEDDEATYRAQAVEQTIIGYLVRATSDPNLPKELPIYDLSPAPGEVRQIHIGRHSKHNTVVINDKSISREHAVISQRQGRLYLRDNASTAGTYLNKKRLNPGEELLLRHNDLVSFGQIVYVFRLQGEDEVTIAES